MCLVKSIDFLLYCFEEYGVQHRLVIAEYHLFEYFAFICGELNVRNLLRKIVRNGSISPFERFSNL